MVIFDIVRIIEISIFIIVMLGLGIFYIIINIRYWLEDIKWKKKNEIVEKNRKIAIEVINEFEELLAKYEIKLPSKERDGNEDEACIWGTDYYDLEDSIVEILDKK